MTDQILEIVMVRMPFCSIEYPAVAVGDGIFLSHPQLSQETLRGYFEQKILKALEDQATRLKIIKASKTPGQFKLDLGEKKIRNSNDFAYLGIYKNSNKQIIAVLHYL